MVEHEPDRVRYARFTSSGFAGTIEVRARETATDVTTVEVTYDMTALTDEARHHIDHLTNAYEAEIERWSREIGRALAHRA